MTICKTLAILFFSLIFFGKIQSAKMTEANNLPERSERFCGPLPISLTDSLITVTPCCQYKLKYKNTGGPGTAQVVIYYGDGSLNDTVKTANFSSSMSWTHTFCSEAPCTVIVTIFSACSDPNSLSLNISAPCATAPPTKCSDCISSFAPTPGKKYLLSAWTKETNAVQSKISYTYPSIDVLFPSISASVGPFVPVGGILDGWQRIEGIFIIPSNATDITVRFNCSTSDCYYDDVRLLPFDGSMKSYVYDPVNMRLVAELDERNYATLYEYDEEGKLIRVKKETEKGKMTIKETRENTKK